MGKLARATAEIGIELPASGNRTKAEDIPALIAASQSEDDRVRQLALRNLCTCHVQGDDEAAWTTIMRLFHDPAVTVRAEALHAMTDSTPTSRVPSVVRLLEERQHEPDGKLRRRIRKTLAHYRRTGKLTDAPS